MTTTQTCTVAAPPELVDLGTRLTSMPMDEPRNLRLNDSEGGVSKSRTWAIIVCVTSATALGSFLNGIISVSLPSLTADLNLEPALMLWPASIFSLTCGCTLLLCGALADLLGARSVYATGCFLQAVFSMACGLATTGPQIIAFRGFSGIAISMCLPTAVSLITASFPSGKKRNIGFACMGGGQTVGFSLGLALGGVFVDTIGWRWSFHIGAVLSGTILVVALWALPRPQNLEPVTWKRLVSEVDWVGALLCSLALSMCSYVLASITRNIRAIAQPANIVLLVLSAVTAAAFVVCVGRRERLGKPAIIPNSLWKNKLFTSVCINVFLVYGAGNATETLSSFYYQYVQSLSATATSVRMLPIPIGGTLSNIVMALTVHLIRADMASFAAVGIAMVTPVLMANADPSWTYWVCCFPAMLVNAVGMNAMYTISNLVITSLFPPQTQGVAGGVYNTIAQIGRSVGVTTSALIASTTTVQLVAGDPTPKTLLTGYQAAWWYSLGLYGVAMVIILWGLRNVGKVGAKKD
ncbi:integral membrane protein [Colletotrichum plurivorum]|uniref:Integral membrane protein n=1 Tax=Colletotrichum plurivorum TaxID=2175906 RepID=A0A8H6J9J4_9PEZI|nr:integral membrane protein [Colletotrichum plurivorum]